MNKHVLCKRILIAIFTVTVLGTLLTGCNKLKKNTDSNQIPAEEIEKEVAELKTEQAEEKKLELKKGAYVYEYTEEFDGEEIKLSSYILFMDGGEGVYIAQDDCMMTWNENSIKLEDSDTYTYRLTNENTIEVDTGVTTCEFKYIGEKLPEDVSDHMRHNLDGTKKVNNFEAADEFDYIINSDTIDFYDYQGSVIYSATGDELKEMTAAYYELTDELKPVLFIKSPSAPHAVGYEHILQFNDGKVYDVAGLDDIRSVWKKSGLIAATYTGGGYGETNYFYYGVDENGLFVEKAYKSVMEDAEYASGYEENFGEKFKDSYMLTDTTGNRKDVTEEQFKEWFDMSTNGEEPLTDIEYKPLDKVFPFFH